MYVLQSPPSNFPVDSVIKVQKGEIVSSFAENVQEGGLVRSPFLLKVIMKLFHNDVLLAGDYYLSQKENVYNLAQRFAEGDYQIPMVRITFPEGVTNEQMAEEIAIKLPSVAREDFLFHAEPFMGYLFPDTYLLPVTTTAEEIVEKLRITFDKKTADIQATLPSGTQWNDVLVMASIIEKEASNYRDRRMISDLLWRRLEMGMRLQVDAPFLTLYGKTSADITQEDLFNDSEYNTYRRYGLPPRPIVNPGLDSIEAALNPIPNEYLFYLADNNGITHFSRTFEDHVEKKNLYLR